MASMASIQCVPFFCSRTVESQRHTRTTLLFSSRRIRSDRKPSKLFTVHRPVVAALESDQSEESCFESPSLHEATIDLQLPRRSLLVKFTCNTCGERTQRLVNRLAYERGTVFVQCAGCLQHHKLVDNLGLVVEYDLREETDADLNADLG